MVARQLWELDAASSSLATPTKKKHSIVESNSRVVLFVFICYNFTESVRLFYNKGMIAYGRQNLFRLEETISFYTRNDFAIINSLLVGNMDDLWKSALIAYNDNKGIIEEYKNGQRQIKSEYDIKWLKILNKRLISVLDKSTKEKKALASSIERSELLT